MEQMIHRNREKDMHLGRFDNVWYLKMMSEFETLESQNVEVQRNPQYVEFVPRSEKLQLPKHFQEQLRPRNRPDKNCDSHSSLSEVMWAPQTCCFQKPRTQNCEI